MAAQIIVSVPEGADYKLAVTQMHHETGEDTNETRYVLPGERAEVYVYEQRPVKVERTTL